MFSINVNDSECKFKSILLMEEIYSSNSINYPFCQELYKLQRKTAYYQGFFKISCIKFNKKSQNEKQLNIEDCYRFFECYNLQKEELFFLTQTLFKKYGNERQLKNPKNSIHLLGLTGFLNTLKQARPTKTTYKLSQILVLLCLELRSIETNQLRDNLVNFLFQHLDFQKIGNAICDFFKRNSFQNFQTEHLVSQHSEERIPTRRRRQRRKSFTHIKTTISHEKHTSQKEEIDEQIMMQILVKHVYLALLLNSLQFQP